MGIWSSIKKAAKKVGRAVVGAVSIAINLVGEIFGRAAGFIGFLIDLLIPWPRKRLRLRIMILNNEDGTSLAPSKDLLQEANDIYDYTVKIFKEEANIKVTSYGNLSRVEILDEKPPTEALDLTCGSGAFWDHFKKAGAFFIANKQYSISILALGNGAPITAFVVRNIVDHFGCSQGAIADYVTINHEYLTVGSDDDVVTSTPSKAVAHEVGHACGLEYMVFREHHPQKSNLMHPAHNTNRKLKRYQIAIMRNSRFVTFF